MIRITIEWDFISPLLRIASGTIKAENVESTKTELLFKCKVKKDNYSVGYKALEPEVGVPTELFEKLRPTFDTMIRSYFNGMILNKKIYEWI